MRVHTLKITNDNWDNIELGRKKFEIRYNDRNYQLGDKIRFMTEDGLWKRKHTDPETFYNIIFVQSGYGLENNFVVLGIEQTIDLSKEG